MQRYLADYKWLLESFKIVSIYHIPREHNEEANRLAHMASGYRSIEQVVNMESVEADDWRAEQISYLKNPS